MLTSANTAGMSPLPSTPSIGSTVPVRPAGSHTVLPGGGRRADADEAGLAHLLEADGDAHVRPPRTGRSREQHGVEAGPVRLRSSSAEGV
jgi:hypothetical protein